jgi:hypothetical protein
MMKWELEQVKDLWIGQHGNHRIHHLDHHLWLKFHYPGGEMEMEVNTKIVMAWGAPKWGVT